MSIGVGITHMAWAPDRVEDLARLKPLLEREGLPFEVASNRHDIPTESQWLSIRGILAAAERHGWSHVLILAEDMLPAIGAGDALRLAISRGPGELVSPFNTSRKTRDAVRARGQNWARGKYVWGSAVLWTLRDLLLWVSWAEEHFGADRRRFCDDELLGAYIAVMGVDAMIPFPCWIEHQAPNRSSFAFNNRNKVAAEFLPDLAGVDWSAGWADPAVRLNANRGGGALAWLRERGLYGRRA